MVALNASIFAAICVFSLSSFLFMRTVRMITVVIYR